VAFKNSGRIVSTNITESFNPAPWTMKGGVINPNPSLRVVAADATLSDGDDEVNRNKNKYKDINDGGWKGHQTAHLQGSMPAGGNAVYLDGHAEWKKFIKMKVRTTGVPSFWW
jgi:prepilin-type processing-associated H-X9-DG protein